MKILKHLRSDWFRYGFETIAVVVGILVAFALDNWSEGRKTQKELSSTVNEIRDDLVLDTTSISFALNQRIQDIDAQNRIILAIQEDLPYDDQIQKDLGRIMLKRSLQLVSSGFNLLRESKITSMEDRDLRSALIAYYEQDVSEVKQEYEDDEWEFKTVWLPYVRHNFKEWNFGAYAVPIDWESLKEDHYFISSLKLNLTNVNSTILSLQTGLKSATKILVLIDNRDV